MKKILISLLTVAVTGGVVLAGTNAFFSDTEVSEDNILQAGTLDLKIDSQAHYDGLICTLEETDHGTVSVWREDDDENTHTTRPELIGKTCVGTWELKDLEEGDTFVSLTDIKPGDRGENTISWHVFDNDAWGRIRITNIVDNDNGCTEPEIDPDPECNAVGPLDNTDGELSENLVFRVWLDEGATPGFQNYDSEEKDRGEGDNKHQDGEPEFDARVVEEDGEYTIYMRPALAGAWQQQCANQDVSPDGHNNYRLCHGLASDGRLVGSATYYIGVLWALPESVGNIVQTDSLSADIAFEVEQHRNNPTPFED